MKASASIAPWLPLLKKFLPSLVVLEEKAAELFHLSLLEKPSLFQRAQEIVFAIERGGPPFEDLKNHLIEQGFQRSIQKSVSESNACPQYFRMDLGSVQFVCPQIRPNQKIASKGLAAIPRKRIEVLLENPHFVDVTYLGENYEVLIPQVGRFILDKGLELKTGRNLNSKKTYEGARNWLAIMDLLVEHEELQEETINDFLEIRPPSLLKELIELLKANSPGSLLWESAQKLYLERHPGVKIVTLIKWYWDFLPLITNALDQQKNIKS